MDRAFQRIRSLMLRDTFYSVPPIIIEKKEEIKKRIKRSPDWFDSLANTFFPWDYLAVSDEDILRNML